jgi:DNA polymerase-3 subunit delta'
MDRGEIIGHRAAIEGLSHAVRTGRLPHALLFQGPEAVGKGLVARWLAATLLCERGEGDPCGTCSACRRVRHGAHPDLLFVRRLPRDADKPGAMSDVAAGDPSELSRMIRIFQIRQLAEHAAHAPREATCRVFIVDPADEMNIESQNALLKTLEEPPGASFVILIASRPHQLLSTVRSRCFVVGFAPVSAAVLAEHLERRGMARAEALARAALAGGRAGSALTLDLDALHRRRGTLLKALLQLAASPQALAELPSLASAIVGKTDEELTEGLELFEALLRDATRASAGMPAGSLLHADLGEPLGELGRLLGSRRAGELVEAVERLRGQLRFNVNRTLLAESLVTAVAGAPLP